jgi:integrase/recombinase XerD
MELPQITHTNHEIEQFLQAFIQSLDIKSSSAQTYKRQLKEFLRWSAQEHIIAPEREDILRYKNMLKNDKALSALTISGYMTAIRRFFEWLESIKKYPNIARGIKGFKRKPGFRKDVLTVAQVRILLNSIDQTTLSGKRDFALLNLMIRTGLRTIEITRATREDLTQQAGTPILMIHGKGHDSKDDMVVITESVMLPIKEYLKARGPLKNNAPLFASHAPKNFGKSLTTRSVSRIAKTRLRAIDLDDPRLTAHSLRHTAITLSLLAGSTPQEAKIMARHADINTTLIYAHNIERISHAPEYKIDEFLGS